MDEERTAALHELDPTLSLMYFALKGMTRDADAILADRGLSRAHHRILFVLARRDGISVGALCEHLAISAQALHRPLKRLTELGLATSRRDPVRHRSKTLHLTDAGRAIETLASDAERRVMRQAFDAVDADAVRGWRAVMEGIARHT